MNKNKITLRAFIFGTLFAAVFAVFTVYTENEFNICITSTQIPVLPYLLVVLITLLINPFCRLIRIIRAFSPVEIMVIFIMGLVSAGLSTFGLSSQLVPVAGSLFNSDWNNKQYEWNEYVVPYLNESYFVSEPGIQAAAVDYRRKLTLLLKEKTACDAAGLVDENSKAVSALEADLAKIPDKNSADAVKVQNSLVRSRGLYSDALQKWNDLGRQHRDLPEWKEVVRSFPPEIEKDEKIVDEAERKLISLEANAFEKAAVFRRGLPRNERAFPGLLPLSGDDSRIYFARLHRLTDGMSALKQMKQSWNLARALPSAAVVSPGQAAFYLDGFTKTTNILSGLYDNVALQQLKDQLDAQEKEFTQKRVELKKRLQSISMEKGGADRQRVSELNRQSDNLIEEIKHLDQQFKAVKGRQDAFYREKDCAENIQLLVSKIQAVKGRLAAGAMRGGELAAGIGEILPSFASVDISLRRYFIGQIPWHCWMRPLMLWAIVIGLTYIVLMSLNVLIFRQWAHNERLTYPLAELAKTLSGEPETIGIPPLFRNNLFWIGLAISSAVLGWNLLCSTNIVPGLTPFDLRNLWRDYVNKTQFEALGDMRSEIFFTMIGLSFFVPKNISFSLWFFYVVYIIQLLFMVWTGHGQTEKSFQWDWWYQTNFRSAQGQGALLVFSSFVLYKCRHYILCVFSPASVAGLETAERRELKISSSAFLACSLALILILWLSMGANIYYTILFYIVILVITIGLIRAVAEGGLLGFQAWASPIHYLRNFFGLDRSWTSASLFAPLMVYYSILYLDIKTCIAPAFANALKLREDFRLKRFSFHAAVALAIVVAAVVAVLAALMMSYDRGGDNMCNWFYSQLPKGSLFDVIKSMVKDTPAATADNIAWTVGGGVTMGALLFFRQFYFWMPHPIGLIMFVNPQMFSFWFPIFIGWLCNVAVTKYGNKDTFHRAKGFFIGLIIGELLVIVVSVFVKMLTGMGTIIELNR
jgi:hypothetical protein